MKRCSREPKTGVKREEMGATKLTPALPVPTATLERAGGPTKKYDRPQTSRSNSKGQQEGPSGIVKRGTQETPGPSSGEHVK